MIAKILILFGGLYFCSLTELTFDKYEGGKVGKLLKDIHSNIESKHFIDEPPGVLIGIDINLTDGSRLLVYLGQLRHVKQENLLREWDWEAIKKERIKKINHE